MVPVLYMTLTQIVVFSVVIGVLQSSSIILLAACIFIGSLVCFCLMGRSGKVPCRQDVWFISRWTCAGVWLGSVIGYSLSFFLSPQSFSFSVNQLWFIAPLISFAPALMSVTLTMCAGDTALFIFEKEEP